MAEDQGEGVQGGGQPVAPQPTGVPQQAPTQFDAEAFARALETDPKLARALEAQVQKYALSQKDRGINKVAGRLDGFEERLARFENLTKGGMPKDMALDWMQFQDAIGQGARGQEQERAVPQAMVGSQAAAPDVIGQADVLELGFDANDAEVLALIRDGKTRHDLEQLALRRLKAQSRVNPAQAQPINVQGASVKEDLFEQYKKEVAAAPTVNERLNVRTKYRKLGLEI